MSKGSSASGGIGFGGLLTVLFVALKLCGVSSWSWWWVFAPLWIPAVIALTIALVAFIVYMKLK